MADDTAVRRAYWTQQMDAAFAFMESMRKYPLQDCGEDMASLRDAAAGIEVVFSDTKIAEKFPRVFFIREGLIDSFQALAREMNARGWILKVEEGYRSPEMQRGLSHSDANFRAILKSVLWELEGKKPDPDFMLRRMSALIATRCRVGTHVSGSAIDISVLDRNTGKELDRGGPYLEMSEKTPMPSPFISPAARQNREAITALMRKYGWIDYPYEFWHYSRGDIYAQFLTSSGKPGQYGAIRFDGVKSEILSEEEADALLELPSFYRDKIEKTLAAGAFA